MMDLQKVREAQNKHAKIITAKLLGSLEANPLMIGSVELALIAYDKERALAELEKPADNEMERAYQMLECLGVPRGRAKTVANGIDVLATRYRKEINMLEGEKEQYAEAYHARKLAEESAAILAASDRLGAALDESDKG